MKYSEILKINETFQYSINLQFDINNIKKIKEYIPTKDSCDVLEYYIDSILGNFSKSTTLIGPYGKGKSHLLLILLTILNDYNKNDEKILNDLFNKIKKLNCGLYEKITIIRRTKKKYMPVIINSNYNNMNQAFLLALSDALEREGLQDLIADTYFSIALKVIEKWENDGYEYVIDKFKHCIKEYDTDFDSLKQMLNEFNDTGYKLFKDVYRCVMHGMEFNPLINMDIVKYFIDINYKINQKGYNGIIIVFDEFSKFLEHIGNDNMMNDLKTLQDFAELANRTGKSEQILLSCITHKTINEYIKNLKEDKINAFKTVEGRFKEILFNKNIEQNYDIISQTIEKKRSFNEFFDTYYISNLEFYNEIENFTFTKIDNLVETLFKGCFPLNPITVYAVISLSEKVAQNERTLFTFLTDDDIYSLKNFISNNKSGLFNIDKVYDYFSASFRKENDDHIKNIWIKSQSALSKVVTEMEIKIIKTIAIINMLNDSNLLISNNKHISLSLNITNANTESIIKSLIDRGVLKFKKITNSYDFSSIYNNEALKEIEKVIESKYSYINERAVLEKIINFDYVIPRRYNQDHKMTRFFKNIFMTELELLELNNFNILFEENFADGIIINLLTKSHKINDIKDKFEKLNNDRIIIKIPKEGLSRDDRRLLKEYESIQYIKMYENKEQDILNEISIIEQEIIEVIQNTLDKKFSKENIKEYWYKNKTIRVMKNLSLYVSEICENIYNKTPTINNEMINKNEISAQIFKFRNIVINTILNHDNSLIKSSTSAEATIYKSIVEKRNNKCVNAIIEIIKKYIKEANKKKNFEKLYNKLYEKPYGIRKGILPILTALALEEYSENIIFYFQNKEIDLDADNISKIVDSPDKYYIMIEKGTAEKVHFINTLLDLFHVQAENNLRINVRKLVDNMRKWILSLPRITRELADINDIISNKSYIEFKNELLKSDLNNYEFMFRKLNEIFNEKNFLLLEKHIKEAKNIFDKYLENYSNRVIIDFSKLFERNSKSNLNKILKKWYKQIDTKIKQTVMSFETKQLFDYIENIETFNDFEIIQNISYIVLGYYIEDWQYNTNILFFEKVNSIIKEIHLFKEVDLSKQEMVSISDGNKEIKKYINTIEVSQLGNTLKNNIEDTLEEYRDSISESEKIKILLQLIKKYM